MFAGSFYFRKKKKNNEGLVEFIVESGYGF